MSHNYGDTIPLHPSSAQSDMDEIESLMYDAPSATVLPAVLQAAPPRLLRPHLRAPGADPRPARVRLRRHRLGRLRAPAQHAHRARLGHRQA
uniref:Uncharacterized protein n=1 Tax=Aegilops tauschii subsp. strangulata TaxID=200361 RepID=A0A453G0F2_AEGTS